MNQREAQEVSQWLFHSMMHKDHKPWATRELSTGKYAIGFTDSEGYWLERWEGSSYTLALRKASRAIKGTMPGSDSYTRAHTLLSHGGNLKCANA